MVVAVRKIADGFILPEEAVKGLHLVDGSRVEVKTAEVESREIRYITREEALRAFDETLPFYEEAYRELAK